MTARTINSEPLPTASEGRQSAGVTGGRGLALPRPTLLRA